MININHARFVVKLVLRSQTNIVWNWITVKLSHLLMIGIMSIMGYLPRFPHNNLHQQLTIVFITQL